MSDAELVASYEVFRTRSDALRATALAMVGSAPKADVEAFVLLVGALVAACRSSTSRGALEAFDAAIGNLIQARANTDHAARSAS